MEARNPAAEGARAFQVAHRYLHVVESNQHGLHDRRVLGKVEPLFISGTNVDTEEWAPIISSREGSNIMNQRLI